MNKLTKLLSVFVIAGAIGTGVAGITACKDGGGGGGGDVTHTSEHQLNYADKEDGAKHTVSCTVDGCDYTAHDEDHEWSGEECGKCHAAKPGEGGETEYENVTTKFDFASAMKTYGTTNFTSDTTIGKFTFGQGAKFEDKTPPCVNTQGKDITIVLGGVENSISFAANRASSSGSTEVTLLKGGSDVTPSDWTAAQPNVDSNYTATGLAAGTYVIKTSNSARVSNISITEKLEKSEATGITVSAPNVDYLKGSDFSSDGLSVILNYANGRQDVLTANDYTVTPENNYNKNVAGKYSVTVTYKENTEFTANYDIYVYTIDSAEVYTIGLAKKNSPASAQQATYVGGTLSTDTVTVHGIGTVGTGGDTRTHKFILPAAAVQVDLPSTAEAGTKQATVSVKGEYTTSGNAISSNYDVVVKAKPEVQNNKVEVTVGATGDFATLTQAVHFLKACDFASDVDKVIKVQASATAYTEKVTIDMDNVALIGLGTTADETKISYSLVEGDREPIAGGVWGLDCATVHVIGKGFKAHNISIRNDFDYKANSGNYSGSQAAQGLALTIDGDGAVLTNCHLFGNQDTLYMRSGRSYFKNTQIDGNIDFIFGEATALAFFDECTIMAIDREGKTSDNPQNGYVTAAKHNVEGLEYGYIFSNCTLTDDGTVNANSMSLGRPWGAKATVAYINCSFSAAYSQSGTDPNKKINRWNNWSATQTAANANFSEFGSKDASGNPIMSTAVAGGSVLTTGANHTAANLFGLENGAKVDYNTAFDYAAALTKLEALVSGQTLSEYTVTIKDTDGNTVGTQKYTEGATVSLAELKAYINGLDSVKNADKEVDKLYSAYTNASTNTEITADYLIAADGDIIITLKDLTSKTYNLLDYKGVQLQGSGSEITEVVPGVTVNAKSGKFNNRGTDVQINTGTIIYVAVKENYLIKLYDNKGNLVEQDKTLYTLTYGTYNEQKCAIITVTKVKDNGSSDSLYLTKIEVDMTQTGTAIE